jgi:hypothetical protein
MSVGVDNLLERRMQIYHVYKFPATCAPASAALGAARSVMTHHLLARRKIIGAGSAEFRSAFRPRGLPVADVVFLDWRR